MSAMLLVFHVVISLIAIASGAPVMYGLLIGRAYNGWTAVFLATTALTSVTGSIAGNATPPLTDAVRDRAGGCKR